MWCDDALPAAVIGARALDQIQRDHHGPYSAIVTVVVSTGACGWLIAITAAMGTSNIQCPNCCGCVSAESL